MKPALFSLCLLFIFSCHFQPPEETADPTLPIPSAWLAHVVDSLDSNGDFNGLVMLQKENETPVYASVGSTTTSSEGRPFTPEDRFYLASLTKLFTGMATLMLMEEHGLSENTPIGPYFPELNPALGVVTIQELANHTNGIHDYLSLTPDHQGLTNQDALELLAPLDSTVFEPGTRWGYSNSGYVLLALLIERVSGETFEEFLDKRIFSKFLPEADRIRPPKSSHLTGYLDGRPNEVFLSTTGGSGLLLSANEWLAFYHNDSLFAPYLEQAKTLSSPWNDPAWQYGFGWFFTTDELGSYRAHSGRAEGFEAFVRVDLDHELFLLILSNKTGPIVKQLRLGLFEVLAEGNG